MPSRRTDQWRCSLILLALSRFSQNIHVASCPVPIFATPRSHQAKPNASPVEADMDLMLEMKSHYQTEIGWNRLDTCIISYSLIYIYIYASVSRVATPPPPPCPPWYGSKTYIWLHFHGTRRNTWYLQCFDKLGLRNRGICSVL